MCIYIHIYTYIYIYIYTYIYVYCFWQYVTYLHCIQVFHLLEVLELKLQLVEINTKFLRILYLEKMTYMVFCIFYTYIHMHYTHTHTYTHIHIHIHTAIYKQTSRYIATRINKYTNNRTRDLQTNLHLMPLTSNKLSSFSQLLLYGMDYHPNYNKYQTEIFLKQNYILSEPNQQ